MQYLIDRAKERSTWLGLIAIATALGLKMSPEQAEAVVTIGAAAGGAISVFTKG